MNKKLFNNGFALRFCAKYLDKLLIENGDRPSGKIVICTPAAFSCCSLVEFYVKKKNVTTIGEHLHAPGDSLGLIDFITGHPQFKWIIESCGSDVEMAFTGPAILYAIESCCNFMQFIDGNNFTTIENCWKRLQKTCKLYIIDCAEKLVLHKKLAGEDKVELYVAKKIEEFLKDAQKYQSTLSEPIKNNVHVGFCVSDYQFAFVVLDSLFLAANDLF